MAVYAFLANSSDHLISCMLTINPVAMSWVVIILGEGPCWVRVQVQDPNFLGGPRPLGPGLGLLPRPSEDQEHC